MKVKHILYLGSKSFLFWILLQPLESCGSSRITTSAPRDPAAGDSVTDDASSDRTSLKKKGWVPVYIETFDRPFEEPGVWIEDTYADADAENTDPFDDNGGFFIENGGADFARRLNTFRSFRKSYTYGENGWLTVELYGRDSDKDGVPESGGRFVTENGKAKLISTRHYDAGMIRSTEPLPEQYRIEVTLSNIRFGGKTDGSWNNGDKINGCDGDETADPWRFSDDDASLSNAYTQNGVYFLCITDYARPKPHNNIFIHHHRKVVMDTDNNMAEWSYIYNPHTDRFEQDGSKYINMVWLNGENFGDDWTGNSFTSFVPRDNDPWEEGAYFSDKFIDGETYQFTIERDRESYTLSVSGTFYYGGTREYRMAKSHREFPVVWHYNQTASELDIESRNEKKTFNGKTYDTWPKGSAYPDYFFFGDPHINYYEGTAEFDDLKLYFYVP